MPDVDEVEVVLGVVPAVLVLDVVHEELHVGRHVVRLDGREVQALDGGFGVLVGHCETGFVRNGAVFALGWSVMNRGLRLET